MKHDDWTSPPPPPPHPPLFYDLPSSHINSCFSGESSPTWRRDNTSAASLIRGKAISYRVTRKERDRPMVDDEAPPSPLHLQDTTRISPIPPPPLSTTKTRTTTTVTIGATATTVTFADFSTTRMQPFPAVPPVWNHASNLQLCGSKAMIPAIDSAASMSQHLKSFGKRRLVLLLLLVFVLVIAGSLSVALGILRGQRKNSSQENPNNQSQSLTSSHSPPSSSSSTSGIVCPLASILNARTNQTPNDVEQDPYRWGIVQNQTVNHQWLIQLSTWLAPFFSDEIPCFPISNVHIETIIWMMEQIYEKDDSYLQQFDAEDWLQAFVVSLLARTWNVAGANSSSFSSNNPNSATTISVPSVVRLTSPTLSTIVPESPLHLCGWKGLGCNSNGQLMSLQWSEINMDLTGTIPSELNLLTPLKLLDLSYSPNLIGSLPESLSFANLQALYLEHTGIEGPLPTLMDSLTDLRISFTPAMQQYGLPSFLYHLTKLEWIEWSQNQTELTRSGRVIPTELGLLTELQGLLLDGNGFTGTIPTEIGQLTLLETLDLSYNHLNSGSLPTEIGHLRFLQWLSLQASGMGGTLPIELTTLDELRWLELGGPNNNFDRASMSVIFQTLPLECTCGLWSQNEWVLENKNDVNVIPDDCGCSVNNEDGD